MHRRLFLYLTLLVLLVTGMAAAQTPATGEIAGTVRDGRGRNIFNARVRVLVGPVEATVRTDRQGAYVLPDLVPGTYQINVSKPGYVAVLRSNVEVKADETTPLNFRLQWANPNTGAAEVLVQDEDRNTLPEAVVDLLLNGFLHSRVPTDESGTAIFPGLAPGFYSAVVRRPGFFDGSTRNFRVRAAAMTAVTVELNADVSQQGRLDGTVRSLSGGAVAGATVKIVDGPTRAQTTTSGVGRYEFGGLIPAGNYAVQVSAPGFATQNIGQIRVNLRQLTVLDITLVPNAPTRGSLTGVIRDTEGRLLPFTTVSITAGPGLGSRVQAGADGRYTFTGLEPSPDYAVLAEQTGYAAEGRSAINVVAGRTTVVDLELRNRSNVAGSISGVVRERGSGLLLEGVVVEVILGPSTGLAVTTDGPGTYLLDDVIPSDSYTLRFTRAGYQPASMSMVRVQPGTRTTLNVELTPAQVGTASIEGTIRRDGGGPLANARVTLFAGASSPLEVVTGRNGAYSFRNLRPGAGYAIRVERRTFAPVRRTGIQLVEGQTLTLDFALGRKADVGSIQGQVLDLLQRPVANAFVRVLEGPMLPDPVRSDEQGSFRFDGLTPGTYTVEASANGFRTGRRSGIFVSGGQVTSIVVDVIPQ